jgi:phosphatidylglycerol---prolipoprotein diacylglyceryl transferase
MAVIRLVPHPDWHFLFEALGYVAGYLAFRRGRERAGDVVTEEQRWGVIAGAVVGAVAGSRLLEVLEQSPRVAFSFAQLTMPGGGRTVVGGLLGGWLGVEIAKRFSGIRVRTGDLFAIPLCIGIGVGRIGCLFAGLADDTYGKPTSLPWGVDFGDGVARHPTQAYEILFLAGLGLGLRYATAAAWAGCVVPMFYVGISTVAAGDRLSETGTYNGRDERHSMGLRCGLSGVDGDSQEGRDIGWSLRW